ncbi:MAG: ATP-binding protein [Acidobacteria bacterium]|nr:ATP-binding protein [Acidobacteriota bacterium]
MDGAELKITIANDLRELAGVAAQIDEFCAARDISTHVAYAVNVSVEELLTNTISYGYGDDEPHTIYVMVTVDAGAVVVEIVDDGVGYGASSLPAPDLENVLGEGSLEGPGFFLLHQVMDSVEFRHEDGYNVVTLRKEAADGGGEAG